jgi:hypothetical protein
MGENSGRARVSRMGALPFHAKPSAIFLIALWPAEHTPMPVVVETTFPCPRPGVNGHCAAQFPRSECLSCASRARTRAGATSGSRASSLDSASASRPRPCASSYETRVLALYATAAARESMLLVTCTSSSSAASSRRAHANLPCASEPISAQKTSRSSVQSGIATGRYSAASMTRTWKGSVLLAFGCLRGHHSSGLSLIAASRFMGKTPNSSISWAV